MTQRVKEEVLADTGNVLVIRRWTGERKTYRRRIRKRRKGAK